MLGVVNPFGTLGAILPDTNIFSQAKNLYSQIGSTSLNSNLSEVDPLKSLGNATAPLNGLWQGIGTLNFDTLKTLKEFLNGRVPLEALKSNIDDSLGSKGASGTSETASGSSDDYTSHGTLEIVKEVFIFIAKILIVVLDIALRVLKGILDLVT